MTYEIIFSNQTRSNEFDTDTKSIKLTHEQYENLNEFSIKDFDSSCVFTQKNFYEPTRHSKKIFPAIWVSNKDWKLSNLYENGDSYLDNNIYWVIVCLDPEKQVWIVFNYYDLATVAECFGSTVKVSFPTFNTVYRLDEQSIEEISKKFF